MLYEGKRYEFRTNDGDLLVGTIVEIVPGRIILEDVDILTELGTPQYFEQITLYGSDVAQIFDFETDERIY